LNLIPTTSNKFDESPIKVLERELNLPSDNSYIRHLRSYFCPAYYYIKKEKRIKGEKFEPRARKGRLIGYGDLHGRIYWIWDPELKKVIRATAVRFNEEDEDNESAEEK
ncbi:hypothetical protein QBC37DRAFT_254380, partial [Rhypophila decipiens]